MIVTKPYLERLIKKAKDSGVDPKHIARLEKELVDLQEGKLHSPSKDKVYAYEQITSDGTRIYRMSTAPIDPDDDHAFDDIPIEAL